MHNLVQQGLDLAVYGMGTVFVFLTMLVFATSAMSRLLFAIESTAATATSRPPVDQIEDPRLIAAITAAIQQFVKDHGQN